MAQRYGVNLSENHIWRILVVRILRLNTMHGLILLQKTSMGKNYIQ